MKKERTPKSEKIMAAGKELFWKHGFYRVNVDEICQSAGVSRMTFYKNFRNKTDLAITILQNFYDKQMAKYDSIINSDEDFTVKAREIILLKIEATENLSKEYLSDIFKMEDSEISVWYHRIFSEYTEKLKKDLVRAQKNGEIRKDINIEFLMYFFNKFYEMVADPELLSHYASAQDMLVEIINFFFYGIQPQKGKTK
ncbi:MAG TPA: TetR/AcrR family transcriptional regulator [Bacteroidales bacterium]|nr:TetR/AcrR family transcriptional regulator [Bacteroidales bacterium]